LKKRLRYILFQLRDIIDIPQKGHASLVYLAQLLARFYTVSRTQYRVDNLLCTRSSSRNVLIIQDATDSYVILEMPRCPVEFFGKTIWNALNDPPTPFTLACSHEELNALGFVLHA